MLKEEFLSLLTNYTNDRQAAAQRWSEIETAYTDKQRYFHNLSHIEQMLSSLHAVKAQIDDWDTIVFAVFYHDFIYDVVRYVNENDNEDLSADEAGNLLKEIGFVPAKIDRCRQHILATKHHKQSSDGDTNFIMDADLLILGQPWEVYKEYMNNIRKEYEVYPDNIFYAGRTHVLKNFLQTERLFKTDYFHQRFENAAKENIQRELEIISFS
ncbi:HD domain-containing protein [Flavisolibacter ginsenosidimutans]|uniref:Metal-dependent HD superfamily phosphohydrolase n=1 Tax=Flavisolibacter ginsenosidimutans TaxID=661481 RepID=A0A5B8UJ01_9BACT|nr:hypothetical protein [Flavisolibacter ginsenosidimutans]QEC55985.1 hypothetical protein FSB75_08790 [Flavisolibacter ginsenosidimutans]